MISYTTELCIIAIAVAAAALSGIHWWRISQRETTQRLRLEAFRGAMPAANQNVPWYRKLGVLIAASPIFGMGEQKRLLKLLAAAGFKGGRGSLANFVATKICSAVVVSALGWVALEWWALFPGSMGLRLLVLGGTLMLGWRLPDIILKRLIKRRRLRLEQGMPDALDLLVICAESGLSLNQSIEEISRQLHRSNKDVADEFAATSAEMQVLPEFSEALDNMVERTGLSDLRSLTATLKQSLKFGTPLAESLRMIAAEMRAARQGRIEERAARLPVLLALPMMLFILPCLLMIVGTPVILRIMDMFKTFTIGGAP
jgi:tight adherence protein C